jgi:CheY-like chemotaxis protein
VITDLQMPEMDGYAFTRAIRAEQDGEHKTKPTVVAFTANTHSEALDRCKVAGMDDYLTKPTELAALREKLARWLGGSVPLNTLGERGAQGGREMLFDRARIRDLAGGPDGLAEVLAELETAVRADIAELQAALARADGAAVRRAAHRIKGAALTIGAERLASMAAAVEGVDNPTGAAGAEELLAELKGVLATARGDAGAARS